MTSLFKPVASGNFYRPPAGQYLAELLRFEDGGMGKDFGDGKPPKPMVRWKWSLLNLDGSPVMNGSTPAEVDAIAPAEPTPRNKTGQLFKAHLKRALKPGDDVDEAAQECIGKRVMLIYTEDDDGNSNLTTFLPA